MTALQLREGRKNKGWTQQEAAARLGVSQPYLALMERAERDIPEKLARKAAHLYRLSSVVLPVSADSRKVPKLGQVELAACLAGLGYPGLGYLKPARKNKNPVEILLAALNSDDLESRLAEALPWVVCEYPDLDWKWLVTAAKTHDLQNRLGFVIVLARQLAQRLGKSCLAQLLAEQEAVLELARLAREDTLARPSLSEAEKRWLRENRPVEARHWNLLTDLSIAQLAYAQ